MVKKLTLFLSISLLFSSTTTQFTLAQHYNDDVCETIAKATIITTVVASCGYGLYKLGQWLFKKTNEQTLCEAQIAYQQTKDDYSQLIHVWSQEIYCPTDELFLCRLPIDINMNCGYFIDMEQALQNLEAHKRNLSERINELENNHKDIFMLNRMKKLKIKIVQLHKLLAPIYTHLDLHKAYFYLSYDVHAISKGYKEEIENSMYGYDEQTLNKLFVSSIMSNKDKSRYPYIRYIEKLESSFSSLKFSLGNLKHPYSLLEKKASELIEYLEFIHSRVIIHQPYHEELAERERNRLKEQQLALEREQLALQREKVHELHEQNRLRRQKLRDKAVERREKRENETHVNIILR